VPLDPESTRRRIFDAAVAEFAAHGGAGARVDRIAAQARANKESIYRYYGTKDELLRHVVDQYLTEKNARIDPTTTSVDDYTAELFRSYIDEPEFLRLLMWEALERGGAADGEVTELREQHFAQKLASVVDQQRAGTIDPDLDPRHLLTVLLGMANYWRAMPQMVRAIFGGEPDEETLTRHQEFIAECVRRIIAGPVTRTAGDDVPDGDGDATPEDDPGTR
jgi:AcrR family transcriptional regulator